MNKQEYNNVIETTLAQQTGEKDSLQTTRQVLNNMGVVLPQGDLKQVSEGLATDDYMGWRKCSVKEAQEYVNEGIAVVAVSDDQIALVAANDDDGEGEVAATSAAVMTLDENTPALAVADMAFYANSRAGTTVSSKESVTVWFDEVDGYVKVLFGRSGKIWHYVGYDQIYETTVALPDRTRMNYFVDGDFGPVQDYSIQELKLLYAIDPYGVAVYIKRFAEQAIVDSSVAGAIAYKDLIFKILFGKEPDHYVRDGNQWYVDNTETDTDKFLSESEMYFGMHKLDSDLTWLEILSYVFDIALIAISPWVNITSPVINRIIKIIQFGLAALSTSWDEILSDLASSSVSDSAEMVLENTPLGWIQDLLSISGTLSDIAQSLTQTPNYCDKIINYCVSLNAFEVNLLCESGSFTLDSINRELASN